MKSPAYDTARVQAFALAYAPAVLDAARRLKCWRGDLSPEEYAVAMTEVMVAAVERGGVKAVEHYHLNTAGGALRRTCAALGIEPETLAHYLGGKL